MDNNDKLNHVVLTSHPGSFGEKPLPIQWGAPDSNTRGPVIATTTTSEHRNVIGAHSGSYSIYRALAIASGQLESDHKADLTNTTPTVKIGSYPSWTDAKKMVSIDPWGHTVADEFGSLLSEGYDIRPTIAVTKAHINLPEVKHGLVDKHLIPDGKILQENGDVVVTKAAVEPVWYLPGVAERFHCEESHLRRILFEKTGGMFPELITRPDLKVFLPPIGGHTVYIFGDISAITDPKKHLAVRVHDECNGSDVFGSDICTCRPYLIHGIELCISSAQKGGAGVIVYNRKEGRALGEVTKFLVYNARKRQEGGDSAAHYFKRTECVAGVQDMRFQELMPDVLHWLGITSIDQFASMSNMKYDALVNSGISVQERVSIPDDLIPEDAQVEIEAKKAAGYYTNDAVMDEDTLLNLKGRNFKS